MDICLTALLSKIASHLVTFDPQTSVGVLTLIDKHTYSLYDMDDH